MKICYGYYNEVFYEKQNISGEKAEIKDLADRLLKEYDWVTILDNNEKDVTSEYC